MAYDPAFVKAIQNLSHAEKDKLILRLLKKDLPLTNRLHFELLADESVEERREKLENRLEKEVMMASQHYYSPGYLLLDLRTMSGEITEHLSITKDKYGEISLTCKILIGLLEQNNEKIAKEPSDKAYTLSIYVVSKVFKLLLLIQKQHEDLHLDFKKDIQKLGKLMGQNHYFMRCAIQNGLDVNWLLQFEIPSDLALMHTKLKSLGLLR